MISIPGIQVTQLLHQSQNSVVYRGYRLMDHVQVVVKTLAGEHPSIEAIVKFRREYEIVKKLNLGRVIKVHQLDKVSGLPVIVMEDGGESFDRFLRDQTLDLYSALDISLKLTETIGEIHQNYIIHKDINPSNILWDSKTREIKVIDFGISSELSRETVAVQNPRSLEGTLNYISPEQTGRMNRAVDYRSDFYSLGATLYHILTGQACFDSSDPMELVHFHIAQHPVPPCKINPQIPEVVSNIVLKLMAKLAEDRYQSAAGAHHDLLQCRQQLEEHKTCYSFPLAQGDISTAFRIPQKLYGRDKEVNTLLRCFDRISAGHREILMVRGYSGVGKSLLIHEVQKPIVKNKGLFIEGKFDQFKRNIPYASIIQAFQELVRQLLTATDLEIEHWRSLLLESLGPNGLVIVDVIPDLALLIGPQPAMPELTPEEANNRFKLTFKNFIKTFANEKHPLVVFLDDLQWADIPSLQLIENLLSNATDKHLLIIGAYRDNEVNLVHPLIGVQKRLEESGVLIRSVDLTPLKLDHVSELISDTLHSSPERIQALAQLCIDKTQGNPFFLSQFLRSLYEQEAIYFDLKAARWDWSIALIQLMQATDNVVHLVVNRLRNLTESTQSILQTAACIGATFSLKLLSIATQLPPVEATKALWPALQAGLVLPVNDAYKFVQTEADEALNNHHQFASATAFKFLHDRVQQAAYSLIDAEVRSEFHLHTGRLLLVHADEEEKDEQIFEIVNHLNLGKGLITEAEERQQLATLNLRAAEKALASSAYGPAFAFAKTGLALLPDDCWSSNYSFSFALYHCALQSAYLTAEFDQMELWAALLLAMAKDDLDRVKVFEVKIQAAMAVNQPLKAIALALQVLALLGVNFPKELSQQVVAAELHAAVEEFAAYPVEDLLNLPEMTDPVDVAAMGVMNRIYSATYIAKPELMILVSCRLALLSLKKGNMPISSFAYSAFGLVLCGLVGDISRGHRFGELALKVYDRYHLKQHKCRTYFMVNNFVWHWKRHLKETHKPLLESYQSGLDTGELEFAGYAAFIYTDYCLFAGKQLGELFEESSHYISAIDRIGQQTPLYYAQIVGQTVHNLMGELSESPGLLSGKIYDELTMLNVHKEANDQTALAFLYVHKLMLNYLFGNTSAALECADEVERYAGAITAMFHDTIYHFYAALSICSAWPNLDETRQQKLASKLAQHREKLCVWSDHCPINQQHKHLLVEAEWHRLNEEEAAARKAYKLAIALAQNNEFLPEEALAYELAAKFWNGLGEINIGELYASHAHHRYQLWGAHAKVKQLEQELPVRTLNQGDSLSGTYSKTMSYTSAKNLGDSLDILSIMKASQAVAGEIVLDSLLKKIMAIVIENAGAQRGVLFLQHDKHWQIVADTSIGQDSVTLTRPIGLESEEVNQLVPRSVIEYVARTRENIVLTDASNDDVFAHGSYITVRKVKSLLCMPIIHQHKINGILYLENNLTTGAFTEQRIELLTLLSSWMSISIDNAHLYQAQQALNDNLENLVEQRTQELSAALKDIEKQGKKLYELAMKDQLTKLYNRHYLLEIAAKTIKEAERFGKPLSIIVIDIDHFKKLNDSHGHQVGDQVLASVAEFLMAAMRSFDVAARFGGEEFVLLLSHCALVEAQAKAEDLREKIQHLQPSGLQVTASFGVSSLELISGEASFNALFKLADNAVYQAKGEGRNRVIVASASEPESSGISGALPQ
jgi:diguanylate cyclase (GGDEF)-like protein